MQEHVIFQFEQFYESILCFLKQNKQFNNPQMQKNKFGSQIDRNQIQFGMLFNSSLKNPGENFVTLKELPKLMNNIENDSSDEIQFNGLIKGLKLANQRNSVLNKNNSQKHVVEEFQEKKNAERVLRPKSKKTFIARNKVQVKSKLTQNKGVRVYFRNQLLSLMSILNRRDDYFSLLKGKQLEGVMPMKPNEVEQALQKLIESKGKDKGRVKFNHLTNEQLRNIKYKAKPYPTANLPKKEGKYKLAEGDYSDEEEEDEEQNKEENMDMATWKRRNGCGYNQKVFIVKGGYYELRKTLTDRGWFENEDVWSTFYDMKWTTKTCDIDYAQIKNGQSVNHFNNNHHLTSKYGLSRRLKTLIIPYGIDVDKFYPRCFDLGDQVDFENFVENFKFSFVESVAKRFLVDKSRYKGLQLKIRLILNILKKKLCTFTESINNINNGQFPVISAEEWGIVTETAELDEEMKSEKLQKMRQMDRLQVIEDECYEDKFYEYVSQEFEFLLEKQGKIDPQLEINGFRNVWIAKPNFLSRGRGIRCLNNLYDIADYCLGKDCQFVIQKYIENPLLISGKKFDIRQWVLIEDFNPPQIWFYEECYLRFCCDQYSLDNINNRFMHLTNNSIQKYNKNAVIDESMWDMKTFVALIGQDKWKQIQDKIKSIIVWSIKSCEGFVTGKKGYFEMVGYDFMIDQNLNPWIIEINMSPSMDHSTPVTKKLVKMVQKDVANLISSPPKKKEKNAGLFTCIYRGDEDLNKFRQYSI